jgi:hypothetical protein
LGTTTGESKSIKFPVTGDDEADEDEEEVDSFLSVVRDANPAVLTTTLPLPLITGSFTT